MPDKNDIERIKFSVIMPAYNSASTILKSIESVLDQTYSNWELIVVNDGSKDNTLELANAAAARDARIKVLNLPRNGGLPNARNQGCIVATGDLIAFLDSDDLWLKEKLSRQAQLHLANPAIDISHTAFQLFDDNGVMPRRFRGLIDRRSSKEGNLFPSICYKNPIGVLTVVVKPNVFMKAGMFDTSLWTFEDQDLWIRIAKQGSIFGYLPEVLASYRLSQSGITSKTGKYKTAYKKFIRKVLTNDGSGRGLLWHYFRCRNHLL